MISTEKFSVYLVIFTAVDCSVVNVLVFCFLTYDDGGVADMSRSQGGITARVVKKRSQFVNIVNLKIFVCSRTRVSK